MHFIETKTMLFGKFELRGGGTKTLPNYPFLSKIYSFEALPTNFWIDLELK